MPAASMICKAVFPGSDCVWQQFGELSAGGSLQNVLKTTCNIRLKFSRGMSVRPFHIVTSYISKAFCRSAPLNPFIPFLLIVTLHNNCNPEKHQQLFAFHILVTSMIYDGEHHTKLSLQDSRVVWMFPVKCGRS